MGLIKFQLNEGRHEKVFAEQQGYFTRRIRDSLITRHVSWICVIEFTETLFSRVALLLYHYYIAISKAHPLRRTVVSRAVESVIDSGVVKN